MGFSVLIATSVSVTREWDRWWGDTWDSGHRKHIAQRIWNALPLRSQYYPMLFIRDDYDKHSSYHAIRGATLLWDNGARPDSSNSAPNGTVTLRVPTKAIRTKEEFWQLRRAGKIVLSDFETVSQRWFFEPRLRIVSTNAASASSRQASSSTIGVDINYAREYGMAGDNVTRAVQYVVNYLEHEVEWLPEAQYTVPAFLHAPLLDSANLQPDTILVTDVAADAESGVLDALTTLAELPETVKYLVDVATNMAEACKATRRREIEIKKLAKRKAWTAVQLAEALASLWLQFRYAIMPNVYTIADIQNTLDNLRRVFAEYKDRSTHQFEMPRIDGLTFNGTVELTERCFIKRSYDAQDVIDQLLGVLKANPLTTAVELITLSFVWEWLINLGSFLTALTGSKPYAEQGAQYSWRLSASGTYSNDEGEVIFSIRSEQYVRRVISPSAYLGLKFRIDMNWMRYLDAIALSSGPLLKVIKSRI